MRHPDHTHAPTHTHEPEVVEPAPVEDRGSLTGYAAVKYGFIFLIVVAILFFVAAYLLPALTD
jgi:hypothetical protein